MANYLKNDPNKDIKKLVWMYFYLVIFEGAIRKWAIGGGLASNIMLIARDPFVIMIYIKASQRGLYPKGGWLPAVMGLAAITFFVGIISAFSSPNGMLLVVGFGLKANFLHLPLIFVLPKIMDEVDVQQIGKHVIIMSIPMAFLIVQQYSVSPDHILNATTGGTGQLLDAGGGRIRPSATFSFSTGVTQFLPLVGAFLLHGFLGKKAMSPILTGLSGFGLVAALAVSGSRGAVMATGIVFASLIFLVSAQPAVAKKIWRLVLMGGIIFIAINSTDVVQQGANNLNRRFDAAGAKDDLSQLEEPGFLDNVYKGVVLRFLKEFNEPIHAFKTAPLFGAGLGLGTNVGLILTAGGSGFAGTNSFAFAEQEMARVVWESGPIVGTAFVLMRYFLALWMWGVAIRLARKGFILPMLLTAANFVLFINGQFGQATTVGFACIGAGLALASGVARETQMTPEQYYYYQQQMYQYQQYMAQQQAQGGEGQNPNMQGGQQQPDQLGQQPGMPGQQPGTPGQGNQQNPPKGA